MIDYVFYIFVILVMITISVSIVYAQDAYWAEIPITTASDNSTKYMFLYSVDGVALERAYSKGYPYPDMIFNTTHNNGYFKLKIPKNFPVDSSAIYATHVTYFNQTQVFFLDNDTRYHGTYDFMDDTCFYNIHVFLKDVESIGFTIGGAPEAEPRHFESKKVLDMCLLQTFVGHKPDSIKADNMYERWTNVRGEVVYVFSDSVEKLMERKYLVKIQ